MASVLRKAPSCWGFWALFWAAWLARAKATMTAITIGTITKMHGTIALIAMSIATNRQSASWPPL
jgi:hypothetical protein